MLQTVGLLKSQASARHLSSCATTERVLNQHRAVIIAMTARTAQTSSTAVQSFLLASLIIIINCPLNRNSNTVFVTVDISSRTFKVKKEEEKI